MSDFFLIAQIKSVFDSNGFVRVISYSDFPERFSVLKKVYLDFYGAKKILYVEEVKKIKNFYILKFKNFNSEKDAQVLVGKDVYVDENDLIKLPEDYYFIHDLIGSKVLRNNMFIGIIKDVLSLSANDVYVIDINGREVLIPAIKEYIESFDPKKKILVLKPDVNINYDED